MNSLDAFKKIEVKDNLEYVFEGNAPAYHLTKECPRLNADYENFEIPMSIREQGRERVAEFRKWFSDNRALLQRDEQAFKMRLYSKWSIQSLPVVRHQNRGNTEFSEDSIHGIERRIDDLLRKAGTLYRENKDVLSQYYRLTYLGADTRPLEGNKTGRTDEEVKKILQEFESNVKNPVKRLIITWYNASLNPTLNVSDGILSQLGFVPCRHCASEHR